MQQQREQEAAYLLAWLDAMQAAGLPDSEPFVEHADGRPTPAQHRRLALARSNDHAKLLFGLNDPAARPTRRSTRELVLQESYEQAWIAVQSELPQSLRLGWRLGTVTWDEQATPFDEPVRRSGALVLLADGGFRVLNAYGYLVVPPAAEDDSLRRALPRLRALAAARRLRIAAE